MRFLRKKKLYRIMTYIYLAIFISSAIISVLVNII